MKIVFDQDSALDALNEIIPAAVAHSNDLGEREVFAYDMTRRLLNEVDADMDWVDWKWEGLRASGMPLVNALSDLMVAATNREQIEVPEHKVTTIPFLPKFFPDPTAQ